MEELRQFVNLEDTHLTDAAETQVIFLKGLTPLLVTLVGLISETFILNMALVCVSVTNIHS